MVYLNAPDRELEGLFWYGTDVATAVANVEPDLVGAPSFSLYDSRSGIDQVYQQQRMFTVLRELEQAGLAAFPNVFVGGASDVAQWARWITDRPEVWVVGSVVQGMDRAFLQRTIGALVHMQSACTRMGRQLHVVLYGLSSPRRVLGVRESGLTHFTCVSSQPAMTALSGRSLSRHGWTLARVYEPDADCQALLQRNLDVEREAIYDAMQTPLDQSRPGERDAAAQATLRPPRLRAPKGDSRQLSLFGRTGRAAA